MQLTYQIAHKDMRSRMNSALGGTEQGRQEPINRYSPNGLEKDPPKDGCSPGSFRVASVH